MRAFENKLKSFCLVNLAALSFQIIGTNAFANNVPALISAIRSEDTATIERECKSNQVNMVTPFRGKWDFPLVEACNRTNIKILTILVNNGARLNVRSAETGNSGLMTSIFEGWGEGAQYLIDHGEDNEGVTPLMLALVKKDYAQAKGLVADKASLNSRDSFRRTAMDYAFADRRFFSLLLESGASNKFSSLQTAAILDNTNQVAIELQKVPLIPGSFDAMHALHLSIAFDSRNAVRSLLAAHVNTGSDTPAGLTALCIAAKYGRYAIIKMLLDAGADPSVACDSIFLPAYYARRFHHTNCLELLPYGQRDMK